MNKKSLVLVLEVELPDVADVMTKRDTVGINGTDLVQMCLGSVNASPYVYNKASLLTGLYVNEDETQKSVLGLRSQTHGFPDAETRAELEAVLSKLTKAPAQEVEAQAKAPCVWDPNREGPC